MKMIIVLAAVVAVALAIPVPAPAAIPLPEESKGATILRYDSEAVGETGYKYSFETSDGVTREESGEIKNLGEENEALEVHGSVSWTDAEGKQYTLNYVANEDGFHPVAEHIPKA